MEYFVEKIMNPVLIWILDIPNLSGPEDLR